MSKSRRVVRSYCSSKYLGPHKTYIDNNSKKSDGHIFNVSQIDNDVNAMWLKCDDMDYSDLLCDDIYLCSNLMSFDWDGYFCMDKEI